jgi:hypothetical protein
MNMDKKDNEKEKVFIAVVIVGAVAALTTPLFSVDRQTKFIVLIGVTLFVLIMYAIFFAIPRWKNKITSKPKLKYWFELPNKNDLKLYLENPKGAKEIIFKVDHVDFLTRGKKKYNLEYPYDLYDIKNSHGSHFPLFQGTFIANDRRAVQLGFEYGGKLALMYLGDDSPVRGFRDGTYEYVIRFIEQYLNQTFHPPWYSIWLVIKDGALVEIKKEL